MFPVEPNVKPSPGYTPFPADDKFMLRDYAPGPQDGGLLIALVLCALWVVYCVR